MRPSPFLLRSSTYTLSSKQHLFASGLLRQVIQEEYCIIKKVFLSQCRMAGIKSFPSLFCHVPLYSVAFGAIDMLNSLNIPIFSLTDFCLGAWLGILGEECGGLYL